MTNLCEVQFVIFLTLIINAIASFSDANLCPFHKSSEHSRKRRAVTTASCSHPPDDCVSNVFKLYYRTFDGSCNNLVHPEYGMARQRYARLVPPKYADGIYSLPTSVENKYELPGARILSLKLYGNHDVPYFLYNQAELNWGQLVGHDIGQLSLKGAPKDCCREEYHERCAPMILYSSDPIYQNTGRRCLHFSRSLSDFDAFNCRYSGKPYAEKISMCTAYLDLSTIYGNSDDDNQRLRSFTGGLMKTDCSSGSELFHRNGEAQIDALLADKRNDINPYLYALNLIFVREHNRIAKCLVKYNPHWSEEILFQTARKINIAQYQKITYCDWLPRLLGADFIKKHYPLTEGCSNGYADNYDAEVNAAPLSSFSVVAFRYNHHRIPGSILMNGKHYKLMDYFNSSQTTFLLEDTDSLLYGMLSQPQKLGDDNVVDDIRHSFKRKAGSAFGTDLKAMDIQRSRDYGIGSYNEYREICGLKRAKDWEDFESEIPQKAVKLLKEIYHSPDDVDLSIGGSYENHVNGSAFGPTFQCIIGEQFRRARAGDRFFWERPDNLTGFTPEQLGELRKASYSSILCNNADNLNFVPLDAYRIPSWNNTLVRCDNLLQMDLSKWAEEPSLIYK